MAVQKTITLSDRAGLDYKKMAEWKGMPMAKLLAQVLETYHQSTEFSELTKRIGKIDGKDSRVGVDEEE